MLRCMTFQLLATTHDYHKCKYFLLQAIKVCLFRFAFDKFASS
jgi:hypothetical protein